MMAQANWRLVLIAESGKREERILPREAARAAKDFALTHRPEIVSAWSAPIRCANLGASPTEHTMKNATSKPSLTAIANAIAKPGKRAPIADPLAAEPMAEQSPKAPAKPRGAKPAAPKKAPAPKVEKGEAELKAERIRQAKDRLSALLPKIPAGVKVSKDIRVIGATRMVRACSGDGRVIEVGSPMFQWTSNRPGNENGYMFRCEACPPTVEDLMNLPRAASAPRKQLSPAELIASLAAQIEADPKGENVKGSRVAEAQAKMGIKSRAEFERLAMALLANEILGPVA